MILLLSSFLLQVPAEVPERVVWLLPPPRATAVRAALAFPLAPLWEYEALDKAGSCEGVAAAFTVLATALASAVLVSAPSAAEDPGAERPCPFPT